jgi:hypothetical protein
VVKHCLGLCFKTLVKSTVLFLFEVASGKTLSWFVFQDASEKHCLVFVLSG